ncbi:hypothetical protein ES705_44828 [subsurface metagenome]
MASAKGQGTLEVAGPDEGSFTKKHLAFIDIDEIFFRLQSFKNERALYNMNIVKENLRRLLADSSWYTLYIPREEMEFHSFSKVRQWQEIAVALLRKYCDRYYKLCRAEFENGYLEYRIPGGRPVVLDLWFCFLTPARVAM